MADPAFDLNDLLREVDSVSRSHRSLVAEFERQQTRLIQELRWYDQQRAARALELRRQFEQVYKESRQQINARSQVVIRERARLQHFLDDDQTDLFSLDISKSFIHVSNPTEDRKRKVYGCLLPQFKAPMSKSLETWPQFKSHFTFSQSDYHKSFQLQRNQLKKFILSPIEQRQRMNTIIEKCLNEFGQCEVNTSDHTLQTTDQNA